MKDDFTHEWSRRNLFGPDRYDDTTLVEELSTQQRVIEATPPTFLFHTTEDKSVAVENAVQFFSALRKHGVTSEKMHIYQKGRHGVGLASANPILSSWPDRLHDWLKTNNWLTASDKDKPLQYEGVCIGRRSHQRSTNLGGMSRAERSFF